MDSRTLVLDRLVTEEGFRAKPYRDTVGKLTIGYGFNLDAGISKDLAYVILAYQLNAVIVQLEKFPWFADLDPARASVLLDIAFNDGFAGLLEFKDMLAAIEKKDWAEASRQLLSSKAARELPGRYDPLAKTLLTGEP